MNSVKSFIKRKRLDWHRDRVLVAGRQAKELQRTADHPDAVEWEREFAAASCRRWDAIRQRHVDAIRRINQE